MVPITWSPALDPERLGPVAAAAGAGAPIPLGMTTIFSSGHPSVGVHVVADGLGHGGHAVGQSVGEATGPPVAGPRVDVDAALAHDGHGDPRPAAR